MPCLNEGLMEVLKLIMEAVLIVLQRMKIGVIWADASQLSCIAVATCLKEQICQV